VGGRHRASIDDRFPAGDGDFGNRVVDGIEREAGDDLTRRRRAGEERPQRRVGEVAVLRYCYVDRR
jgi:hypothetical protein